MASATKTGAEPSSPVASRPWQSSDPEREPLSGPLATVGTGPGRILVSNPGGPEHQSLTAPFLFYGSSGCPHPVISMCHGCPAPLWMSGALGY